MPLTATKPDLPPAFADLPFQQAATLAAKHATNLKLAEILETLGETTYARALRECTVTEALWICTNCGNHQYHVNHCQQRLCAICAPKQTAKRSRRVFAITQTMTNPKWLTLTMSRAPDLAQGLKDIRAAFGRGRRLKNIKCLVNGGLYKLEAVPKPDGWHVHIHAIIDGAFLPVQLIWSTWKKSLRAPHGGAHIKKINGKLQARDFSKYAAKPEDVATWTPAQLHEFVHAWRNVRMWQTYGKNFNFKLDAELNDPPVNPNVCEKCGSTENWIPIRAGPWVFKDEWLRICSVWAHLPDQRPIGPATAQDEATDTSADETDHPDTDRVPL
jgi:hypothetical protein